MDDQPEYCSLTFRIDSDRAEVAEELLWSLGACAVSLVDAGDHSLHEPDPGTTPLWPESVVQGLFEPEVDRAVLLLGLVGGGLVDSATEVEFQALAGRDWSRVWMDRFRPMRFGKDLWICPSHLEPDPDWPVVVRLDPGLAFGTGTHPTTALCLEWIDGMDLNGRAVLDYGSGSGVLAVAAALKGATPVIAVDHDPQAVAASLDNAARNGAGDRVRAFLPGDDPGGPADLALANILAGPLVALAPKLIRRVAPGGRLVLSGLLETQADEVARAYVGALEEIDRSRREGWMRLVFSNG